MHTVICFLLLYKLSFLLSCIAIGWLVLGHLTVLGSFLIGLSSLRNFTLGKLDLMRNLGTLTAHAILLSLLLLLQGLGCSLLLSLLGLGLAIVVLRCLSGHFRGRPCVLFYLLLLLLVTS